MHAEFRISLLLVVKCLQFDWIASCSLHNMSCDFAWIHRKWGIEKLVYRDVKRGIRRDRKYAIQPRNVFATGVHMSQNFAGKTTYKTEGKIKYFHYHGTIAQRREPCRNLLNVTEINFENVPYVLDTTMRDLAWSVKKFELKTIGPKLQNTRQWLKNNIYLNYFVTT